MCPTSDTCGHPCDYHASLGWMACMRKRRHAGPCISLVCDALRADKPHGRDCPDRCSICLGVPVRRIEQVGGELTIDGVTARPVEPPRMPFGRDFKRRRKP